MYLKIVKEEEKKSRGKAFFYIKNVTFNSLCYSVREAQEWEVERK